jgi:hypothetical protein
MRVAYAVIKANILKERNKRVVLILHSQGGIEGSLVVDWLLSELPSDMLQKLEIYTFGCAANHFNNPHRSWADQKAEQATGDTHGGNNKCIRHIEHYANNGDFVARWGVMAFTGLEHRFMGRVFIWSSPGHLLNQHYLNIIFPLRKDFTVMEDNAFMNQSIELANHGADGKARESMSESLVNFGKGTRDVCAEYGDNDGETIGLAGAQSLLKAKMNGGMPKVKELSRLWQYRNGMRPED